MEIKYEAVFGDQALFDGMMGDCEFASEEYGYIFANGALYYCERYNEKAGWALSCKSHLTFKPSAMRRTIKEPKQWTWEDKKAGRLPDVGAEFSHCHSVDKRTVLLLTDKHVGIECDNSDVNPYFVTHAEFIKYYIPIETPREKYDRERDECIDKLLAKIPPSPITVVPAMKIMYEELRPFTGDNHD